jgi:hypothetical protein
MNRRELIAVISYLGKHHPSQSAQRGHKAGSAYGE